MIGVDTNLLLRWLIHDPEAPEQEARAVAAMSGGGPFFINPIVLAELAGVLATRVRMKRQAVAGALSPLFHAPQISVESIAVADAALGAFERGGSGFTDHLIRAANRAAGCSTTLTLDRRAAKGDVFTEVP